MRPDGVFDVTGTDKKARRPDTSCSLYLAGLYRQTIIMTQQQEIDIEEGLKSYSNCCNCERGRELLQRKQ